jgi:hypothetical protein
MPKTVEILGIESTQNITGGNKTANSTSMTKSKQKEDPAQKK